MTQRAQVITITVLLAAVALIFILVGNAGVSTAVFLPETTLAPEPTIAPTPLPASAANWSELSPRQFTYTANPALPASFTYDTVPVSLYIQQMGLQAPDEGTPLPLLALFEQLRTDLESELANLGIPITPGLFEGPAIVLHGGVPVTLLRLALDAQATASGQAFPGLDLALAAIDLGDDSLITIQYILQAPPDSVAYADFLAWLDDNAAAISAPEDPGESPPDVSAPAEPQATEDAVPEATEAAESD